MYEGTWLVVLHAFFLQSVGFVLGQQVSFFLSLTPKFMHQATFQTATVKNSWSTSVTNRLGPYSTSSCMIDLLQYYPS
jgi:hypothetical protein